VYNKHMKKDKAPFMMVFGLGLVILLIMLMMLIG
jgi:hypothetical protein